VRYELSFSALLWTTIVLTGLLMLLGIASWPRVFLLWVITYGVPYIAASLRFERMIKASASEIVERRHRLRTTASSEPASAGTDSDVSGNHIVDAPPPDDEPPPTISGAAPGA
jgi:hypothetical protein